MDLRKLHTLFDSSHISDDSHITSLSSDKRLASLIEPYEDLVDTSCYSFGSSACKDLARQYDMSPSKYHSLYLLHVDIPSAPSYNIAYIKKPCHITRYYSGSNPYVLCFNPTDFDSIPSKIRSKFHFDFVSEGDYVLWDNNLNQEVYSSMSEVDSRLTYLRGLFKGDN